MFASELPNDWIGCTALAERANVQGSGEEIVEGQGQLFGQLFVEEQAHDSGGRDALRTALTFGGVRQASPDILPSELRKVAQNLVF